MSYQGRPQARTYRNVRNFWELEAKNRGASPQATIRDLCFRKHELYTLLVLIPRCRNLLDAGCGTGFGTLAMSQKADYTLGVDYSASMIRWAVKARDDAAYRSRQARELKIFFDMDAGRAARVEFIVGDIRSSGLGRRRFDVIAGQRILINLRDHTRQMLALKNLRRHSTDNARLFLTEATLQGHRRTDIYRERFGLPPLEKYWHNNYVDESRYGEWARCGWRITETLNFETYVFLSKVVYPAAVSPENCEFLSGANEAACEIACLFRTETAAREIGTERLLRLYADRTELYDKREGRSIRRWADKHAGKIPDWGGIGHQRLVIARAAAL